MNCKQVDKKLLFYLDEELDEKEKQAIERHLAACPSCQSKLQSLENTRGLLHMDFDALSQKSAPSWLWMELKPRLAASDSGLSLFSRAKTRLRTLITQQPKMKTALVGILSLALITSAVMFVPRLLGPSAEVVASDVARDTPEILALAGGTPFVETSKVAANTGYVLSQGPSGESNLAYVDLQQATVVRLFIIAIPPLTEDDKTQSLNIARADPHIQQILDSGGTISTGDMFPLPPQLRLDLVNGQPMVWSEGTLVGVVVRVKSLVWLARIDLGAGKVGNVSPVSPPSPTQVVESPASSFSKEEAVDIARTDTRVKDLLDQGATIDRIAIGHGRMANNGALILKRGDEIWSVRVDLSTRAVTRVEMVPKAKHGKTNLFNPT